MLRWRTSIHNAHTTGTGSALYFRPPWSARPRIGSRRAARRHPNRLHPIRDAGPPRSLAAGLAQTLDDKRYRKIVMTRVTVPFAAEAL